MTIKDERGRILLKTKPVAGKVEYMFARYEDMTETDKKVCRTVFNVLKDHGETVGFDGCDVEGIDDFLDFRDRKPDLCG
jgi:hypothetical protein